MFNDVKLPWKPFGLTLTFEEWDDLVAWYIHKNALETLDTKEN